MKAYAVKHNGQIDVRTVGPTERSAKVNWLWVMGVQVLNSFSDELIVQIFKKAAEVHHQECVEVEITEVIDAFQTTGTR
jgi:hypothetical protein